MITCLNECLYLVSLLFCSKSLAWYKPMCTLLRTHFLIDIQVLVHKREFVEQCMASCKATSGPWVDSWGKTLVNLYQIHDKWIRRTSTRYLSLGVLTQNDLISVSIKILIRSAHRPCPGMCKAFTCFPSICSNKKRKRLKSAHLVTCSKSRSFPRSRL